MKRNEGDKDDDFSTTRRRLTVACNFGRARARVPERRRRRVEQERNNNAYEEMMRQMEEENKGNGGGGMSAESLFKESGDFQTRVRDEGEAGNGCRVRGPTGSAARREMTAEERSFGKKPKTAENGGGEKEAMSSDGGIRFTFSN